MPDPNGGSGKKGMLVAVAAVVVILLIAGGAIAAGLTMGNDDDDKSADDKSSQSSDPTDQPSDEPTSATSEPTDEPTTSTEALTECPVASPAVHAPTPAGIISSGGISVPVAQGYTDGDQADQYAKAFTWLRDPRGEFKVIEEADGSGWISLFVVGSVKRSDGYGSLETAAQSVTNCMANSDDMYRQMSGATPKASKQITVDGHNAWEIETEIAVDDPNVKAQGDHAIVIAVEVDDAETYAIFAGVVPIGDQKLLKGLEKVVSGMTVD